MESFYECYTLKNGIRVVHKEVKHTQIAHCGFVLDIGSRDEKPYQQGIAHFWEHMAFKGTQKRKAYHIINRLESVGGDLNAYTTKEKICFHASILDKHYAKALELLTDITFDSIFPETQIERERNVILEEMAMCLDSPDDAIQDEFDAVLFDNHPLGNHIFGTPESVKAIGKDDFSKFIQENINTHQIVFASVGNLPFSKVLKLAEKYMEHIPEYQAKKIRNPVEVYQPKEIFKKYQSGQAYCALGNIAYSLHDPRRLAFTLVCNLLGGPSLNSRLNLALREKLGYVYSVEANYHPFSDAGMFAIYFATEKKNFQKSLAVVNKELKNLRNTKLGTLQLHQAKEQLLGQLAMAEESNLNFMLMMASSILDMGKIEPLDEVFHAVRQLTAEKILEVAQEEFKEDQLSMLVYEPEENM